MVYKDQRKRRRYLQEWKKSHPGAVARHSKKAYMKKRNILTTRPYGQREAKTPRDYWLKKKYGITNAQYQILSEIQNGLCAICGRVSRRKHGTELVVDHSHETGRVRGLLCNECNAALGFVQENVAILEKMIAYVKKFTSTE